MPLGGYRGADGTVKLSS